MAEARKVIEFRALNVAKDFRGMPLLAADTGAKLGEIRDAIIQPTEGRVMGAVVRTLDGDDLRLRINDIIIGEDAVMTSLESFERAGDYSRDLAGGFRAVDEVVGANVVTENGDLLGRITEVYIRVDKPQAVYRVAESTLRKFFGKGFFLAGDAARSFAPDGARMIVPSDTEQRYAASSLAEAL
ncbi:MAG TPA: PRC-barrel domain-containing protein [Blastocatellia bacterium]|nr:PRC-barrel domain-containing protein [Blastocatellia bacterium]